MKEILLLDAVEHHEQFKGCLYVLLGSPNAPLIIRHDWDIIRDLWPLLVRSKPSEKPSIVNLMTAIVDAVRRLFPTISITLEIPEGSVVAATKLANIFPKVVLDDKFKEVIASGQQLKVQNENSMAAYNKTIELLLNACTSGDL